MIVLCWQGLRNSLRASLTRLPDQPLPTVLSKPNYSRSVPFATCIRLYVFFSTEALTYKVLPRGQNQSMCLAFWYYLLLYIHSIARLVKTTNYRFPGYYPDRDAEGRETGQEAAYFGQHLFVLRLEVAFRLRSIMIHRVPVWIVDAAVPVFTSDLTSRQHQLSPSIIPLFMYIYIRNPDKPEKELNGA